MRLPKSLARETRHRSGSRTRWRRARSLPDAHVADERVRGLLVEPRCPLEAIILLELQEHPLGTPSPDTSGR